MKSLNTYNYHEQLYMKAISYQVSISDDDKIIKIEEDGDLIAELSFAIDRNILFLNGKDGMEVAQIELPVAMASITNQAYDAETKSIDLTIMQSNGESVVFSLDVEELVNVYTAGDGIDITDNVISIKIKDASGTLTVDEEGLDINLDSISDGMSEINSEIDDIQANVSNLKSYVDNSINTINENVNNGFVIVNEAISALNSVAETTVQHLNAETADRITNDDKLQEQVFALQEKLATEATALNDRILAEAASREQADANLQEKDVFLQEQVFALQEKLATEATALNDRILAEVSAREQGDASLQEQIGNVTEDLEGSIAEEIGKIKEEIGDVKGELEGSIAEEIGKIKEEIGDVKGELEGSITDAINDLQAQIGDVKGELEGSISENITMLDGKIAEEATAREEKDTFLENLIVANTTTLVESVQNVATVLNSEVEKLNARVDEEASARESGDNQALNAIANERTDRINADEVLNNFVVSSRQELGLSINLVKDETNNLKYTLYVDGREAGVLNIPADKMVESVVYDSEAKTLTFTWNTNTPQSPTSIYIGDLVDVYLAGDGLLLHDKTFKVNVETSKYIDINENGSVEFVGVLSKPEGTNWKYDLIGKNGVNNNKFIDFTSDYESFNSHIQEVYAPLTYVDAQDLSVKSELIGVEGDEATVNTIYGLRSAIAKSEEVTFAKIAEEQARAEAKETDLDAKIDITKADLAGYVNQEIAKVNDTILVKEEAANVKHDEMSQNIKANSDILASLTNGEQTGVVDKLDKQFHEITRNIDENSFEGLIKSLMDRISQLEATISVLTADNTVVGSIANSVSNSLNEAKLYAQEQDQVVVQNVVAFTENTYQHKGDYLTEIDAKYITEDELASYNFVNSTEFSSGLNSTLNEAMRQVSEGYQVKGEYITSIPSEYITETELETKHYATVEYVIEQDSKLLSREMADLLYAVIDTNDRYVKTSDLINMNYVTKQELSNATYDMATQSWVSARYQEVGNYLTEVPKEYVTDGELSTILANYSTQAWVHSLLDNIKDSITDLQNNKLSKVEAISTYQKIGDYVTVSTLEAKDYVTNTELFTLLENKATVQYVDSAINNLNIGNYVTKGEMYNMGYVTADVLASKGYIDLTTLNGAISDMETKTNASMTYLTKTAFEEYTKTAFSANNIVAGDNIKLVNQGSNLQIGVALSSSYNVVDTYNQNLPSAGQNLDQVSEKLSEAIKKLYDTTDGEVF